MHESKLATPLANANGRLRQPLHTTHGKDNRASSCASSCVCTSWINTISLNMRKYMHQCFHYYISFWDSELQACEYLVLEYQLVQHYQHYIPYLEHGFKVQKRNAWIFSMAPAYVKYKEVASQSSCSNTKFLRPYLFMTKKPLAYHVTSVSFRSEMIICRGLFYRIRI